MQISFDPFFVGVRIAFAECALRQTSEAIIAEARSVKRESGSDLPLEDIIKRTIEIRASLGEEVLSLPRVLEYLK